MAQPRYFSLNPVLGALSRFALGTAHAAVHVLNQGAKNVLLAPVVEVEGALRYPGPAGPLRFDRSYAIAESPCS